MKNHPSSFCFRSLLQQNILDSVGIGKEMNVEANIKGR